MTRPDAAWTFIDEAVDEAAALLEQMEPANDSETQALQRATAGLNKLRAYVEREQQRSDRGPLAAMPLMLGLPSHPDPDQARYDHLVQPLLIGTGSITTVPQAKAWLSRWIIDTNEAVNVRTSKGQGADAR